MREMIKVRHLSVLSIPQAPSASDHRSVVSLIRVSDG
jgi:hypothetical protein